MRFFVNLILFLIAVVLGTFIGAIGFVYSILDKLGRLKFKGIINYIGGIFYSLAADIDKTGNFLAGDLLNDSCGDGFGNINETVSSRLGKNERDRTLRPVGKALCWVLDKIDKDHCKKSINNNV